MSVMFSDTTDLSYLSMSRPEYQVVIVVEPDNGKLFPLTEKTPRCVLPLANRPMLHFQLDLLISSGATEVYVVCSKEDSAMIGQCVSDYKSLGSGDAARAGMTVELIAADDIGGSADALRCVNDRIRSDVLCINSDFISQFSLGDMARHHRCNAADVTLLLAAIPLEESEKKGFVKKIKIEEEDQEYIGLDENSRVIVKRFADAVGSEHISFDKRLIHRCKSLCVRNDLQDMGVCFLSKWALEYLSADRNVSSVRLDLLPRLLRFQFQSDACVLRAFPSMEHRYRSLQPIEGWLIHQSIDQAAAAQGQGLADHLALRMRQSSSADYLTKKATLSMAASISRQASDLSMSTSERLDLITPPPGGGPSSADETHSDLIRLFAFVHDPATSAEPQTWPFQAMHLVDSMQVYMGLNRDLPALLAESGRCTPWGTLGSNYSRKEQTLLGSGCEIGDKVTYKQCTIGSACKIGSRSRMNSCVIMNGVVIGEGCTLQNTVACPGAVIENNCSLNDCYVGAGARVPPMSKVKGDSILAE